MYIRSLKNYIIFLILSFTLAVAGCSSPYYGYTKADWNNLSDEQQIAIKQEYQNIIDSKSEQAHQDIIDARTRSIINRGVEGLR